MKITKHAKSLAVAAIALAFVCVAFAFTTKANAATVDIGNGYKAEYVTLTDSIVITGTNGTEEVRDVKIYSLKNANEDKITSSSRAAYTSTATGTSISVPMNTSVKGAGLKIAENKAAYLYIVVSGAAVVDSKANFCVAPTAVQSVKSVSFDYGKTYPGTTQVPNVNPVLTVKYQANGADAATTAVAGDFSVGIIEGKEKTPSETLIGTELNGDKLYGLITKTEKKNNKDVYVKYKLSVKILGKDTATTVDSVSFNAGQRGSKAKAVSPKNPAKAPKVKVDYLAGTIALKAGFDYVVMGEEVATPSAISASSWNTILPVDAEGTAAESTIASTAYTYYKKMPTDDTAKNAAKPFFYNGDKKAKSLKLADLCATAWAPTETTTGTAVIYVRKTATDKAPASAVQNAIKIAPPTAAPTLTVSGSSITAYNSTKKQFAPLGSNISGANLGAKTGSEYEFIVVMASDLTDNTIDWTKVKWAKLGTTKNVKLKLSTKIVYKSTETPAVTRCTLKEDGTTLDGDVIIVIRGAGVKESRTAAGILPTEYVKTKFVASGSGENATINWVLAQ